MPPRRNPRASLQKASSPPAMWTIAPVASSASPGTSNGTTLVQALEHMPILPKVEAGSEDDLTPPPAEVSLSEQLQDPSTSPKKRKRASAKTTTYAETPEPDEGTEKMEKPKKGRKKAVRNIEAVDDYSDHEQEHEPVEEMEEVKEKPTKKKATSKKKVKTEDEDGEEKSRKKPTPKKSRLAKDEPEFDDEGNEIVKKKRKVKVYGKIVYAIPPVERKESTFRGRLGYACLNTVLRGTKPDSIFCSRTCRIPSIEEEGMELPKGLALMNAKDLVTMIEWNEQNKIRFMRMSSEMFPFASHAKYGYNLAFADKELKEAGALARKYGHRLTMHPGQFTQLGSPKHAVVEASVRELDYQCEIMDRMGLDQDGVMIIHMGGIYGDKPSTLARFKENYTTRLKDNVKKRLVLENDEICYNVDDIFPVCDELDIPIIFDYHHDWIYPSSEPPAVLIPKIAEIWKRRGIRVKQHLSEPRPGAESVMEKRAHADRCKSLPKDLPEDVDLMIEAKDKEQAVFELYRIYGLEDVVHDNLRPPDAAPGLRTKGRKSSLKKKVKETGDVDSDGNSVELSDVEKEGDGEEGDESLTEPRTQTPNRQRKVDVEGGIAVEGSLADIKPKTPKKRTPKGKKAADRNVEDTTAGTPVIPGAIIGEAVAEAANGKPEKPKVTPRKRTAKKVAEEVKEEIEARIEDLVTNGDLTEKPKAARKRSAKKLVEEVLEEIEATIAGGAEEAHEVIEEVKQVQPPPRKRGRPSKVAQLA